MSGQLPGLLASLGGDGRDFERLVKWFLQSDPEFRARYAKVWLWDEWPDRWDRDKGIDLIARTHAGALVAIQAKHYAAAYAIKKADVDSFLAESNRAAISERLLIATTDRLGRSCREVMAQQEKPVSTYLRRANGLAGYMAGRRRRSPSGPASSGRAATASGRGPGRGRRLGGHRP